MRKFHLIILAVLVSAMVLLGGVQAHAGKANVPAVSVKKSQMREAVFNALSYYDLKNVSVRKCIDNGLIIRICKTRVVRHDGESCIIPMYVQVTYYGLVTAMVPPKETCLPSIPPPD